MFYCRTGALALEHIVPPPGLGCLTAYDDLASDDAEGLLAVRYLSGKKCVGRGSDGLRKYGGDQVNRVLTRCVLVRKIEPLRIVHELSVEIMMKIETRHEQYELSGGRAE
jgi:hypothetical protein